VLYIIIINWHHILSYFPAGAATLAAVSNVNSEPIAIINNTRGGIIIFIQSKKGNVAIGGGGIKMPD
jgi:hypothetical protein